MNRPGRVMLCTVFVVLGAACGPVQPLGTQDAGGDPRDGANGDAFVSDPFVDDDGDGYTENQGDCNDNNAQVHPFAEELCEDGLDNNCNGATDGYEPDGDGDGFGPCQGDCDDDASHINPAAPEVEDGVDNNCDGIVDGDYDGDGFTTADGDCDDDDPEIHPDALENCFDGIDNNCNTYIDSAEPDSDGDNYGPCDGDCDDTDAQIGPHMHEIPGDGIDNNCDFLVDQDIDGDGWTVANGDCDDDDEEIHPAAPELCDDGVDNNCDGVTDTDCLDPCDLAQFTQTYLGCEFYAVDLPNTSLSKMYGIVVSNPSDTQTANVTITTATGTVATWAIPPNELRTYEDASRSQNVGMHGVTNRAYHIVSDLPVAVYQFNSIDTLNAASTDASLIFAKHSLARLYYVMDYTAAWANNCFIAVVATEANTNVTIYPNQTVSGATTATLNPYDVMVVIAQSAGVSLTGSRVEADKPVGVFGGNTCTQVPYGMVYCDHVEEMIFPRQAVGTYYVVGKTHARTHCDPPDYLRVLADADNTTVTFNPPVAGPWTLNAGEWQETTITESVEISATEPVYVGQYIRGSNSGECSDEGDPAFMLQVPVDQFRHDYIFLTPQTYDTDYVDIMAPLGATVWLDGAPVTLSNQVIGASGHTLTSLVIPDGPHMIDANEPVGIMVYAYGGPSPQHSDTQNVSYGYAGGLNLSAINPVE